MSSAQPVTAMYQTVNCFIAGIAKKSFVQQGGRVLIATGAAQNVGIDYRLSNKRRLKPTGLPTTQWIENDKT